MLDGVGKHLAQLHVALDVLAIFAGVPAQDGLESRHERLHRIAGYEIVWRDVSGT